MSMMPRFLAGVARDAAARFAAVVVTGPRRSGKTTLTRMLFGQTHNYCGLDDPILIEQARNDPHLLLSRFPPPVILDEIQNAPGLLITVKASIDREPGGKGRFVITGSQPLAVMEGVTESLAGRAAVLSLLSLSHAELAGSPSRGLGPTSLISEVEADTPTSTPIQVVHRIRLGGFPEPALDEDHHPWLWHSSYVQTYLERDVRQVRAIGDLSSFRRFILSLAARTGGLLNIEELARDIGVAARTVREWTSVLEATGQVAVVPPYHENLGKRLVKRPKAYFLDTGILSYLLGLREDDQAMTGVMAGPLFEASVFGELFRLFINAGELPRIYFWRTAAGHEVDFVVEVGGRLVPIEAKATATPRPSMASGIEKFQALFGSRAGRGLVVCLCDRRFPLTAGVDAVPLVGVAS